ncbi:MAG: hypothetical protein JXR31_09500 [Prolixibacteraceae bacterium]|nr:hypothetical protein [Prolixibacteraceae bacterium]MBN2774469.1 hypothetical protein [Prolixibacteraceae bacterium]
MDQHQQKKQLERLLIDLFKENYPDFPKGKIIESESPDFIVERSVKFSVGIELTRLYPESQVVSDQGRIKQYEIQDELIDKIREQFEGKSSLNCFVKIQFDESIPVTLERILSLSVRISRLIIDATVIFKKGKPGQLIITKELPDGIRSLLVFAHPGLNYSVWERSNNLGISSNLPEDIQHSINKKDDKLKLYERKHLSQYWLLITTDHLCQQKPVNISNILRKNKFLSDFDKVFILELFNLKSYMLK